MGSLKEEKVFFLVYLSVVLSGLILISNSKERNVLRSEFSFFHDLIIIYINVIFEISFLIPIQSFKENYREFI